MPVKVEPGSLRKPNLIERIAGSDIARIITLSFLVSLKNLWKLLPTFIRAKILHFYAIARAKFLLSRLNLKFDNVQRTFNYDSFDKEVITIDGIKLSCTHLYPHHEDKSKKHPCILMRTPYYRYFDYVFALFFVLRGYHVLLQDVRGMFQSTGELTLDEKDQQDAGCTLKWIAEQPWSNKEVALVGVSMGGYTSWSCFKQSLKQSHGTKIKAVVPMFSSSNIFFDGSFIKNEKTSDTIVKVNLLARYTRLMYELQSPKELFGSTLFWVVFKILCIRRVWETEQWNKKLLHLPLSSLDIVITEDIPKPRKLLIPNKKYTPNVKLNVSDAVPHVGEDYFQELCLMSGWYDIFYKATIRDYTLACKNSNKLSQPRLMIGNFGHFDDYIVIALRTALQCFAAAFENYKIPAKLVMVWCIGSNNWISCERPLYEKLWGAIVPSSRFSLNSKKHQSWRYFDCWPPQNVTIEVFSLCAANSILPIVKEKGGGNFKCYDCFVWNPYEPTPTLGGALFGDEAGMKDQLSLILREDTLFYSSPSVQIGFEVAGEISFEVWVSSSCNSIDICAKLCLCVPVSKNKFRYYNLCDGIKRVSVDSQESWPKKVHIVLGHTCVQFGVGTKVGLLLSGGSFPQYSRNLGFGEDLHAATDGVSARHAIFWKDSRLSLPIVKPKTQNSNNLSQGRGITNHFQSSQNHIVKTVKKWYSAE